MTYYIIFRKIKYPRKIEKIQVSGQHKLFWQSKQEFQNIDPDIFYIDVIKSNNDKIYDFITISKTGHLTAFNGENGHLLFNIDTGPSGTGFTIADNNIILGTTNGKISAYTKSGKKSWENQIADLSRYRILKKKPGDISKNNEVKQTNSTKSKGLKNKKLKNQKEKSSSAKSSSAKSNIKTNTKATNTFEIKSPLLMLKEKLLRHQIIGKIPDIHLDFIQTKHALFSINLSSGKVRKSFKSFNSELIGMLAYGDFNNDYINDYLVCETNSIHCLDGRTLKELWQTDALNIISGNKNVILNKNKEIFIILPYFNGVIRILNQHGTDVFEIKLNEYLIHAPLVFKNKYFMFLQQTMQNNIYAFNFEKRKNIWSINVPDNIKDVRNIDIDYDNINEILLLTETGKIYIINSENGSVLDSFICIENQGLEKVTSNLAVFDIDNDNNYEFCFATDKGNVYVYKYALYNKKFILKKIIKSIISKWKK